MTARREMEAMDAEILRRTFPKRKILEIGAGPFPNVQNAGIEVLPSDHYLAVEVGRVPRNENRAELEKYTTDLASRGIKLSYAKADGFELPVKSDSIDHLVMNNVLSEPTFPNSSMIGEWHRVKALHFRKAVEKLEAEMRRVAKPGATAALQHHFAAEALYDTDSYGKSRLQHIKEVFGPKWHVEVKEKLKQVDWRGKPTHTMEININLRKKQG